MLINPIRVKLFISLLVILSVLDPDKLIKLIRKKELGRRGGSNYKQEDVDGESSISSD